VTTYFPTVEKTVERSLGKEYVSSVLPVQARFHLLRETRESNQWLLNGIPHDPGNKETTLFDTVFKLEDFLSWIKNDQGFGIPETKRVLSCLEGRGLISAAVATNERNAELVSDFLLRFCDYEKSPYIKEKLAHGRRVGRLHASDSLKQSARDETSLAELRSHVPHSGNHLSSKAKAHGHSPSVFSGIT
jgi:hypothetical protein